MASEGDRKECAISNTDTCSKRWWTGMVKMSGIMDHVKKSTKVNKLERTRMA